MLTGVINIYKEKGFTSHDVVAVVRKIFKTIGPLPKVGHIGTLDPQAQGVLPICVGRATKLAGFLTAEGKSYRAELILGMTTDTGDHTGTILTTSSVVDFPDEYIEEVIKSFVGGYMQKPPMYSAVKINGKRLYEMARAGQEAERRARRVEIYKIQPVTKYNRLNSTPEGPRPIIELEIDCGKGTYIRSLCEDIGERLGCGGCMGNLVRTKSGAFTVENAIYLSELEQAVKENRWDFLVPVEQAFPAPIVNTSFKAALSGHPVQSEKLEEGGRCWLYYGETLIGLFCFNDGMLRPEVMIHENHK